MRRGFFLTFEGLDGSGKTTQLRSLASVLREQGESVVELRQPGGTALGDRLRALLVEARDGSTIQPRAELALMFADRAQAIAEVIEPALAAGQLVLCDRWTDSTEAYQGAGRELGADVVHALDHALCGSLRPDLTLLLLPPLALSLARARRRNERHQARTGRAESRFEQEAGPFFERAHGQYQAIAAREPLRVVAIEDDAPLEQIHLRIVRLVEERLAAFRAATEPDGGTPEDTP